MKWIKEHKLITCLLVVIVATLVILVSSISSGGKDNPVSSFLNSALTTVSKPFTSAGSGISNTVSGMFSYKDLQDQIDKLEKENEELKNQVTNLTLSANQLSELKELKKSLNYKGKGGSKNIVSGDIVSMDGTNWMNIFTINIGSESGISVGDIVVSGDGLVGRIKSTGNGSSKVVSITDASSKISFKVSGNLKLIGVVEASNDGVMDGFLLDNTAKVSEGDELVTSGMGVYPEGISIGKITKVRYDSDSQLQKIDIKSSVDFMSLQKVSVLI